MPKASDSSSSSSSKSAVVKASDKQAKDTPKSGAPVDGAVTSNGSRSPKLERDDRLPIKMLNDRIMVEMHSEGDRRSTGGILIPATAQVGKRLSWAEVRAVGPNVRAVEVADQVLFNPNDRYEVEVHGHDYIILRERDIHAVASERLEEGSTGLYI